MLQKITAVDRIGRESGFWQNIPGYLKGRDAIIQKVSEWQLPDRVLHERVGWTSYSR